MSVYNVLPDVSPSAYTPHALHNADNAWVEKNCYIDLYVEVLHGLKKEPLAMLPFTLAVDFVGDQWTFFKPQLAEMRDLFGIDVQEMSFWRSLLEHTAEHLSGGRIITVEVDAFWLPDTQATDYRKQHTKTTIAITQLDTDNQNIHYFHNAGFYQLGDEDYRKIFRLDGPSAADYLNPYAELIHIDRLIDYPPEQLRAMSFDLVKKYLKLIPNDNPVARYAERFKQELRLMQSKELGYYHLWAFNNTRQLGAAFELAAANLKWLSADGKMDFEPAINCFQKISADNKTLILKVARAVNAKRDLDLTDFYRNMANDWEQGMLFLQKKLAAEC